MHDPAADNDRDPLLNHHTNNHSSSPFAFHNSSHPHLSPSSSSSSSSHQSASLKQYALILLAACVVGYLAIVYFELAPDDMSLPHTYLMRRETELNCHQHFHNSVDDPLTVDERIDHLLYRTLRLAIQTGDEQQAASVATELARAYQQSSGDEEVAAPASVVEPKPAGPSKEDADAARAAIVANVTERLRSKTDAEWEVHYAKEEAFGTYFHRDYVHLWGNHRFTWNTCESLGGVMLGDQCSVNGNSSAALAVCDKISQCLGVVCNKNRQDCQIRVTPLTQRSQNSYHSYYKSAKALAAADTYALVKHDREMSLMRPGSTAAPDFDPKAQCSKTFKCVIAYGLYGTSPKYGDGAIENAKLQPTMFPDWVIRIYHDETVPAATLDRLVELGAELRPVDTTGMEGDIAGMFWRFLVADDSAVQRYIVRDTDSRLNPRERAAVDEWLASGYSIHSIRDHPNHDRPLNGGLWGGVRGSVKNIKKLMRDASRNGYGADLVFLNDKVWPQVQYDQIAHDSYTCDKYVNSVPFPTKRPDDFQHVGQVFEGGRPRWGDIACCMEKNPTPIECRKEKDWIYG